METNNYTILFPYVYNNFYKIYSKTGRPGWASHFAFQALKYSKINKNIYIKYTIFRALNQLYESQGMIDSAYFYQKIAITVNDSITQNEKTKGIEIMELKYAYQQEMLLNKIQEEKKQNTYLLVIMGLILITGLTAILVLLQLSGNRKKQLENEKLKNEKIIIQKEMEIKTRELACNLIHMTNKNQLINKVIETLSESDDDQKEERSPAFQKVLSELNLHRTERHWDGFNKEFSQINPAFYQNLSRDFPSLTQNEIRICAFIRLNMSSKEISEILHLNYDSIYKARTRIRKKMNLTGSDENLIAVVSKY